MQAADDLVKCERPYPRRGEFDGQRHAVEPTTDLGHCHGVGGGHREVRPRTSSPVAEQLDGLVSQGERRDLPTHLACHQEGFAARREDRHAGGGGQQVGDQFGTGLEEMLAVVQHEEHPTVADEMLQRIDGRATRLVGQAQRASDRDRHHGGMGDRGQVGIPDTVGITRRQFTRDLNCQTCLAGPAGTRQSHEAVIAQECADLGDLRCSSHEAGQLHRKVMDDNGFRRTQWREVVADIGMAQLRDADRARQVT